MAYTKTFFLLLLVALVLLPQPTAAFGAGNIASISRVEGQNWRHGDIEDMLKTVANLKGHKWTSMMIKRVYFGNWLRDYSQAVDVGTLKGVQAGTIRVLIWVLAFMTFGYATAEFEVTDERLGCYRPEEHIDNPKDYADNEDARKYDKRLRGPVLREELEVDPQTGMKNYIANERGGWATSAGYVKFSVQRSIHYGRLYTSGPNKGREEDLCEALRCLGQALHCLEDFGAHTQYVELALRELGHRGVFPHVGSSTEINVRGKRIFPLVTGTFGGVDFLHSVLGEASDHVTQSEVDDMNEVLGSAQSGKRSNGGNGSDIGDLTGILSLIPGTGDLASQAESLQRDAESQSRGMGGGDNYSSTRGGDFGGSSDRAFNPMSAMGGSGGKPTTDPQEIIKKIYPILQFRDNVVRTIDGIISKIPGLESAVEKLTETVTLFVMRLLAPYIMPLIGAASQGLKQGSSAVVDSSAKQQYVVFDNANSSDPTHSMLSKDHFSNVLNEPAGKVAAAILQYAAPRILYAWEHPEVPEQQVMDDVVRVFHHPALRDENNEAHKNMFRVVEKWVQSRPDRGRDLDTVLSKESVRAGHNHKAQKIPEGGIPNPFGGPGAVLGGGAGHAHGPIGGGQARGFDSSPAPVSQSGYGGGGYSQQPTASHGYGGSTGGYDSGASHGASGGFGGGSSYESHPARHGRDRDDSPERRPHGGRRDDDDKYGSSYRAESPGRGGRGHATHGSHGSSGGYGREDSYGQQSSGYGQQSSNYGQQSSGYGQQSSGYGQETSGYGQQSSAYGQQPSGYGSGGHDNSSSGYGGGSSYDRPAQTGGYDQPSYGGNSGGYGGGHGGNDSYGQQSSGYGSSGYGENSGYGGQQGGHGRRDDDDNYGRRDDDDDDRRRREQGGYGQGGYDQGGYQQQGGYGSGGYGGSGYGGSGY